MKGHKQEWLDNYFKDKSSALQETMGFYWAMKSRDFIPFVARIFKKHIYVLQDARDDGTFPNPRLDDSVTCFHEFQDWLDLSTTKAGISMYNKYKADVNVPKKKYDTKSIIELNAKFLSGYEKFENWKFMDKKNFIREALWNFDDESEAFGYASKEFAGQLLQKLIVDAGIRIHEEMPEDFSEDIQEVGWNWTVSEIWKLLDLLEDMNKGLPTRNDDAPEQSDEGLDLISSAMGADNFVSHIVDFLMNPK